MAKSKNREIISLECTVCKNRNYTTMKNKKNDTDRLVMKKYCRFDKKHTDHKEARQARSSTVEHRSPKPGVGGSNPSGPVVYYEWIKKDQYICERYMDRVIPEDDLAIQKAISRYDCCRCYFCSSLGVLCRSS